MRAACQLAVLLVLLASCAAGQSAQEKENGSFHQPAVLSAEALEYGAELAEHASEELRDWAAEYVEDHLRWEDPDLQGTVDAVEKLLPGEDGTTQNAVAYLVLYLAYADQLELERSFVRDRKAYAQESRRIVDELDMWQRYGVPPAGVRALPGGNNFENQEANRMLGRLRELRTKSRMRGNQLRRIRQRVDFYLRVMDAAHEQLARIAPEKLAEVHPQRPE